ncbi:ATP-binding cassette domain-containing protein [Alloscardovia criceti]|uniref:ATP-binding cassette domain-containing protein n=1 Tax=Alloscardovia criceti TaxID=356828 RepID=UPI000368CECE|nr:ATP-binding cassette domain-containing protein [Alloscardovia criceti]
MGSQVEITHWSYRYPLNENWAVHDMNLSVTAGEKVLLTGRSGWGKSTLLHGIAGILGDAEDGGLMQGSITIDGVPALQSRGRVGLIMQDPDSQIIFARVFDNATFGAENLGVPREEIIARAQDALETVDIDREHGIEPNRLAQRLSGGQVQRLTVASLMTMQPDVIVCDEPTANLDPEGIERVVQSISDAAEETGATLIIVDHNADVWLPIITRHIVLHDDAQQAYAENEALDYAPQHPAGEVALTAENLCFGYEGEKISHPFSAEFRLGTITALTGVNGAGKTTLSLTLAGLLPLISGEMKVSDVVRAEAASALPSEWSSQELAQRIQYVFQNPEHQFVTSTVIDEMASALRISHAHMEDAQLRDLAQQRLEYYDLAEQKNQNPYSLSGGQKRRLTVACAIESKPSILIVDEPTYGQDPRTWRSLLTMFAQLRDSGTCIIMVTHDRAFIRCLGARELVIEAKPAENAAKDVRVESESRFVAALNPMTRLFAGIFIGLPLIASLDIVSSSVALMAELVLAFMLGFKPITLAKYTWPIMIGAAGSFVTVMIYNAQHDWTLALATALRVLAMGVPAIALVMRMDPTDLADAFVQKLKLSDRFVYAALAGFRLLPLLKVDLESIHQARTIRGLRPQSWWRKWSNDALSLLVLAIRRSTTLSLVMQARGFGSDHKRTNVRISTMGTTDTLAFVISILIPVISLLVAYYGGTLNLFGNLI